MRLLLPFVIAFVYIPAALGGILCLVVVSRIPAVRVHALVIAVVAAVGSVMFMIWTIIQGAESNFSGPDWFQEILRGFDSPSSGLLPSWWLSTGLLEAARDPSLVHIGDPPWAQSLMFFALLVSNALLWNMCGSWLAGKVYRTSFSQLYDEPVIRRQAHTWWFDGVLSQLFFIPRDVRLLLVKDFRLFRRDPLQWSQFLIFFGLLALYFVNIRRFSYNQTYSAMIGFLNLAVVGLILSTFTTRFIFPMISLEGRRLWILGLMPIRRDAILWSKFLFAAVGSLVPCTTLVLISDLMLQIKLEVILIHQLSCVVLCLGLSAIAVGLGAKMPDLRAHSPSKIAAGFGGTLNLVVSAAYIVIDCPSDRAAGPFELRTPAGCAGKFCGREHSFSPDAGRGRRGSCSHRGRGPRGDGLANARRAASISQAGTVSSKPCKGFRNRSTVLSALPVALFRIAARIHGTRMGLLKWSLKRSHGDKKSEDRRGHLFEHQAAGLSAGQSFYRARMIVFDLPSRLADDLAAGRLDVALIPSIEYFQNPEYNIVSNACIACRGPVLSVKLFSRKPAAQIRTFALDEGSQNERRAGSNPFARAIRAGTAIRAAFHRCYVGRLEGRRRALDWRPRDSLSGR